MLLAIDIGNTNITLGTYDKDVLSFTARIETKKGCTADEYAVIIKNILILHEIDYHEIEDAIISSVVPYVSSSISQAISILCHIVPIEIGPGVKTGLNIKIDNPAQLGADIVAGAVGAINEYNLPCAIIDMGTATTISVVNDKSEFIGTIICAGIRLTLDSLTKNTSQLPSIDLKPTDKIIGKNTVDSMRSGLIHGTAAMIDGIIDRISNEIGEVPTIVATGGFSKTISNLCRNEIIFNDNLLLEGLKYIYELNK